MNDNEIRVAAQVYGLCADTIRKEIAVAEQSVERLRSAGVSTVGPVTVIERLRPILTKFEALARIEAVPSGV